MPYSAAHTYTSYIWEYTTAPPPPACPSTCAFMSFTEVLLTHIDPNVVAKTAPIDQSLMQKQSNEQPSNLSIPVG